MVELAEIQAVYYMVAATGVLVAAIYYVLNMRATQKNMKANLDTRQAQLLMQIYDKVNNRDFSRDWAETNWFWKWSDYNDYFKKYGTNLDEYSKLQNIIDTYEGIGIILMNKLVDPKLIYGVLRVGPILYWEKFSPMMKEWGAETGESLMYPGFEFLYKEMGKQYEIEHGYGFDYKIRHVRDVAVK
jgi:hypothetical protein